MCERFQDFKFCVSCCLRRVRLVPRDTQKTQKTARARALPRLYFWVFARVCAAMSSEDAALAQRLQAKDNALRSLTKRYLAYTAAVESSSEEECKALYEGLMLEVDQYELAVGKAEALVETNVRQVAEYDDMQQRVEAEM